MSLSNLEKSASRLSEQALESSRLLYAGAICAIAALPLLLTVALMMVWGA